MPSRPVDVPISFSLRLPSTMVSTCPNQQTACRIPFAKHLAKTVVTVWKSSKAALPLSITNRQEVRPFFLPGVQSKRDERHRSEMVNGWCMFHLWNFLLLYMVYHTIQQPASLSLRPLFLGLRTLLRLRTQRITLPLPRKHQLVHAAHVVFGLAHIRQPCSPCSLRSSPDDINACDRRAVDLEPHLHSHLHHLTTQENRRVLTSAPDLDKGPGKWLAHLGRHHQNIAHLGAVGVLL